MGHLLVLLGMIGIPSAALAGPVAARDSGGEVRLLAAGSADAFERVTRGARAERQPSAGFRAKRPGKRYSVTIPIGKPRPAVALPRVEGPDNDRLPLVVIDAGHGGHDPGAISPHSGAREKDITLALARAIRADLLASGRVRVALTRADDRFLVLEERFGIARRLKADLFISIHADSIDGGGVKGASIYTLSEVASDKEAAELARKENAADIIAGVDLSTEDEAVTNILIDLAQRETNNRSVMFARLALPEIARHTSLLNKPHRFAGLVVLKAPDVPSILVECGFLSNADEEDNLNSPKWRRGMGRALAKSVDVYYERMHAVAQTDARHQTAH